MVPQSIDEAFRLSEALSKAGDMVPKAFQGRPMEVMAAVMRGMEVGLAPMQALASICVINGRAALWGDALPALMQCAGHHVDVVIEGDGDKMVAIATLTRGDTKRSYVRRFSMADAKRAGLAAKPGPWQQYPARMLSNRARAFAIRDGAADALMGLTVSDEISDYGPDRARDVTPRPTPGRGGVVYAEPDPMPDPRHDPGVDHIIDADTGEVSDPTPTEAEIAAAMEEARREAEERDGGAA
jgi:hypothetical protein